MSKRGSGWWFVTIPADCENNSNDIYIVAAEMADPCPTYGSLSYN